MKSIKTKLRYCLTLLVLGLFSFSTSYAQDVPTDEEVSQLFASQDARTLEEYFLAQGYNDGGIIQGSQAAGTTALVVPSDGRASAADDATIRSYVVAKQFKNAAGEIIEITYGADKPSNSAARIQIVAENGNSFFSVIGGRVTIAAKGGSSASKFDNCWRQYGGGIISNCLGCYNCLKDATSGNASNWVKAARALKCVGPCFRCLGGIIGFVNCVR